MFNDVIMFIMGIGILLGAFDKMIGNRFGLGKELEDGFKNVGVIVYSVVGIITIAPLIGKVLSPVVVPLFSRFGIDPSLCAIILANDLGGYSLAMDLCRDEQIGLLVGTTVTSMIGCTIVFAIPVGIGMIEQKDYAYFFKGVMFGIIAMPVGSVIAGLFYGIGAKKLVWNMLPLIILALIIILGIKFFLNVMVKFFEYFGKFINLLATAGLALAAFDFLTGITLVEGLNPISKGMDVLVNIGIVLMGSYPIVAVLQWLLQGPLGVIGKKLKMNATSMLGLIIALANSVPVFGMIKKMDKKGKVVNSAWVVCAAACLGAHLGYTAGVAPQMISVLLIGKLSAGLFAVIMAMCSKN